MLIYHVSADARGIALSFFISENLLSCCLKKSTKRLEESHNLWLRKDIWKDLKVCAEFRKAIEIHQVAFLVSIKAVVGNHRSVNATKDLDDRLVFEDIHQVYDLILRIVSFLGLLDILI